MSEHTISTHPDHAGPILSRTDRLSAPLRAILVERARPDDPAYEPRAVSPEQLAVLRAVLSHVVPQDRSAVSIDLAARLDAMMADETGNGWRYEALPGDPDAYRFGLDTLDAMARAAGADGYAGLAHERQHALLAQIAEASDADGRSPTAPLTRAQMALWFEELRSDAIRLYVAHPAVMAEIGYSGPLNGAGSGAAFDGFERVGMNEREPFEPNAQTGVRT